ncbi:MAG: hypothetical protein JO138_07865 [Acidobacteriaceae bacterium]|nr:hypothetical protein [Acidobacteriaceae bacterium]
MSHISEQQPAKVIEEEIQQADAAIKAKAAEVGLGPPKSGDRGVIRVGGDGRGYLGEFEGGNVYWTLTAAAHAVRGPILVKYISLGAEKSCLGYPTSDELSRSGGISYNIFENGEIDWENDSGPTGFTVPKISVQSKSNELGADLHITGCGFTPGGLVVFQVADLPGAAGPVTVGTEVTAQSNTTIDAKWGGKLWHTPGTASFQAIDQATGLVASYPIDALY